jgi:hypothetical protein
MVFAGANLPVETSPVDTVPGCCRLPVASENARLQVVCRAQKAITAAGSAGPSRIQTRQARPDGQCDAPDEAVRQGNGGAAPKERENAGAGEQEKTARDNGGGSRGSGPDDVTKVGQARPDGYSLASSMGAVRGNTPPETCDAIRNATTTAGRLISLRN